MYLETYAADKDELLDAAFKTPKLHPKKNPTTELALRVVGDLVNKQVIDGVAREVEELLLDAVIGYELINGDHADVAGSKDQTDYESGMDDAVENAMERFEAYLSADWLAKNTIDTGLWESTEEDRSHVSRLAQSAAKEIYKQITAGKTPAQTLASAGITAADVEARLAAPQEKTPMTDTNDLQTAVANIATYLGKGFDEMAVFDDLDMLCGEDDEVLVGSAASRLGASQADVDAIQIAALDLEDPASDILTMLMEYKPQTVRAARAEAKAEKAAVAADGLDTVVFEALKECGAGDTAMAEALGVSRSTYTNYVKGKTQLNPDADQAALLRKEIVDRTNRLLEGLAALDGTEPQVVA